MSQLSRRLALTLLGSAALMPALAMRAQAAPALPVDQASRDPALVRVRAAILKAIAAKDFKQLRPHVAPRIQLDFGGGAGVAELGKRLAAPGSPLWEELRWVFEHGGRFEKDGSFSAPYSFSVDIGKIDTFEGAVIVSDNVAARAEPRADARLVATLGREIVKVVDWRRTEKTPQPFYNRRDWVKLDLPGKGTAWVEAKYVRATTDYRAGLTKMRGVWKMNYFLAGD
jgi:hypothetical protein